MYILLKPPGNFPEAPFVELLQSLRRSTLASRQQRWLLAHHLRPHISARTRRAIPPSNTHRRAVASVAEPLAGGRKFRCVPLRHRAKREPRPARIGLDRGLGSFADLLYNHVPVCFPRTRSASGSKWLARENRETVGMAEKLFVLGQRHLHRFCAVRVWALADPFAFHLQGIGECLVDACDLLVDEPVKRFVPASTAACSAVK